MSWQLQEAKNRFSEVVSRALTEGPQTVTRRGTEVVVVVSVVTLFGGWWIFSTRAADVSVLEAAGVEARLAVLGLVDEGVVDARHAAARFLVAEDFGGASGSRDRALSAGSGAACCSGGR